MKYIHLFLFTILFLLGCSSTSRLNLINDIDAIKIFTQDEISSLSTIVSFFDEVILKNTNENNIRDAYANFFENLNESKHIEYMSIVIVLSNSDSLKLIIENLESYGVFFDIWNYAYEYNYNSKNISSRRLAINLSGRYLALLETLGEKDEYFKEYITLLKGSGCIDPALISYVMKNYKIIDYGRDLNRLIIAVHYITILSEEVYRN